MGKFKTWNEFEKELNFTKEENAEFELEKQIIEATINIRKKLNMTQRELSERSGIKQPNIVKLENQKRSPQVYTLLRILLSMGYTLKVVPLSEANK